MLIYLKDTDSIFYEKGPGQKGLEEGKFYGEFKSEIPAGHIIRTMM